MAAVGDAAVRNWGCRQGGRSGCVARESAGRGRYYGVGQGKLGEVSPIFVVGMARSGTSLLAAMLSSHSSIAILPETHLLTGWYARYGHAGWEGVGDFERFWEDYTSSKRFAALGLSAESVKRRILTDAPASFRSFFLALMAEYACLKGKTRSGEKTPAHYGYLPLLFEWFPQARVLFLLRDPRAVVASLLKVPWAHRHAYVHAAEWCECVRVMETWRRDPRVTCVRYETLVVEPEATIRSVCAAIHEEYEPSMLVPGPEAVSRGEQDEWEVEHWRQTLRPPSRDRADAWRSSLDSYGIATVEQIARVEMLRLGYEPVMPGLTPAQRARWVNEVVTRNCGRALRALRRSWKLPMHIAGSETFRRNKTP